MPQQHRQMVLSCVGALFPYTITVKTKPNVAANMTAAICSGSAFAVTRLMELET
jgi:hypothetical protein